MTAAAATTAVTATPGIRVCIDRGGTFTDCIAFVPDSIRPATDGTDQLGQPSPGGFRKIVVKLLSVDPQNYDDAPREGIRRILEIATGRPHPRGHPLDTTNLELIRMGTTVATNALLERRGEKTLLLTTRGFADLLHIGNQSRPRIFDLSAAAPGVLHERVIEVDERVALVGDGDDDCDGDETPLVRGVTGERVRILRAPDTAALEPALRTALSDGIRSVAICLLHAFTFPHHERILVDLCTSIGFDNVTASSDTMPMVKMVPRGMSTVADAYLTPCIRRYLDGFFSGFDEGLRPTHSKGDGGKSDDMNVNHSHNARRAVRVEFMQSDGGLVHVDDFNGFRAILSGPAGGVVGYAKTSWAGAGGRAVIGFDMGGTSTDVSRYSGRYEHVYESTTAGVTIQAPQLDINTVAAGGGSRLFFRNGMFVVGPESAGADPGPMCYRKSGPLTITDANLLLGRLVPDFFPKIFGKSECEALDLCATQRGFDALVDTINAFLKSKRVEDGVTASVTSGRTSPKKQPVIVPMTRDEVAQGFIRVANESMCRPIRALTEAKGYSAADHVLACFGGAGGQHAFAIARSLGIRTVLIHRHSSILSAYGIALADVVHEAQEPSIVTLTRDTLPQIQTRIASLTHTCTGVLTAQGFNITDIDTEVYLNLRYHGTDNAIMTLQPKTGPDPWDFASVFVSQYQQEFGFILSDRDIVVDDVRVRGIGRSAAIGHRGQQTSGNTSTTTTNSANSSGSGDRGDHTRVFEEIAELTRNRIDTTTTPPNRFTQTYWEPIGRVPTPVFLLTRLNIGDEVVGPALIIDDTATIGVEPGCVVLVTSEHVVGFVGSDGSDGSGGSDRQMQMRRDVAPTTADPVLLSVFGHRFMSIAEQMGRTLQKTAISTNIKERLDFSCALFGPDGGLVANAPHIPVHLGSMQEAVRWQMRNRHGDEGFRPGQVILTNHPAAGGSHLPDMTVITPVFDSGVVVFFVASRGHHADIGGTRPGSMPPDSRELVQEGAAIMRFDLVRDGVFDEEGVTSLLVDAPAVYPGCSGTRALRDNLSDLKAQVAANQKGIQLVTALIGEYGLLTVQSYMGFIRLNAEMAVRHLFQQVARSPLGRVLASSDVMDDGSVIRLKVSIDDVDGSAVFDFSGTGMEVYGNTNAPRAVTYSAIIYCLRSMIDFDMPLNQGALTPVTVIVPEGSLLNPSDDAAVVGGNVLTSQRVCDVVLKAFEACAASQGCCNNLTFGRDEEDGGGGGGGKKKRKDGFGYYETIAGGCGAGPTWHGRSGVHTHMTNTRITDPEILERRYPVFLRRFALRRGSGGFGHHTGGDGVVREIEFMDQLHVSVLTERRVFAPYGLNGGGDGMCGRNTLLRRMTGVGVAAGRWPGDDVSGYRAVNLGGKNAFVVHAGDVLRIETPGGGGWGAPDVSVDDNDEVDRRVAKLEKRGRDGREQGGSLQKSARAGGQPLQRSGGGSLQAYSDMQNSA